MFLTLCKAHQIALEDASFDMDDRSEGWSSFFTDERKRDRPDCRRCRSHLIEQLEGYDGGLIDLGEIKKCYKVIAEVSNVRPIEKLMKAFWYYEAHYGRGWNKRQVHGKFGGYAEDGTRILLFYESTMASVNKRLDELEEMVKNDVLGNAFLFVERGCHWMKEYIYPSGDRSCVRNPEKFLKELEEIRCRKG